MVSFSLSLELRNSASRWAPETCLTLLPQRQGYINMCHHAWLFNRGSKSGAQVLMLAWQTLHRPSHLPDPCSYYFDFKYRSLMSCFSSLEAISYLHIAFPLSQEAQALWCHQYCILTPINITQWPLSLQAASKRTEEFLQSRPIHCMCIARKLSRHVMALI